MSPAKERLKYSACIKSLHGTEIGTFSDVKTYGLLFEDWNAERVNKSGNLH